MRVAWTGSVICKQYKFVLKIQGFLREETYCYSKLVFETYFNYAFIYMKSDQ
jgi:hypothetical protein